MTRPNEITGEFDPLDGIIASYLQALEAGQNPSRDQLLAQHSMHAARLRTFFADLDALGRDASQFRLPDQSNTVSAEAETGAAFPRVRYLGDYELIAEIARGGMGVIYRARQVSLNRAVAIKMILAGTYATETAIQRFRAEAEAAANLEHPHILPIYEVGEHDGHQYFSMKLVEGGSLAQHVSSMLTSPRKVASLVAKLARAVHFAHQRGILHRDLKPANVLIDVDGCPYITDFGLAKRVDGDDGSTRTGAIVGTPSYMAPEQARGEKGLSTAADVYSLGAILYELIAGQPPFRGDSVFATVKLVLEQDPIDPRLIRIDADRDLSVIALKCLTKSPAGRYASADELANDLDRWQAGVPIHARPASALERGWKFARRRPAVVSVLIVSLLALVGGLVGLTVSNRMIANREKETKVALGQASTSLELETIARVELKQSLTELMAQRNKTESVLAQWRQAAYVSDIALASIEWNGNRPLRALQILDECAPDLRGWEWHHLQRVAHSSDLELPDIEGVTVFGGTSRDGKTILTTNASSAQVRDAVTGKVLTSFEEHEYQYVIGAIATDGRTVISASAASLRIGGTKTKGDLVLWDAATAKTIRNFIGDFGALTAVAISPDSKLVATLGVDGKARLWNASTGDEVYSWAMNQDDSQRLTAIAFSPDGRSLAASQGQVLVWDIESKKETARYENESSAHYSLDGRRMLTVRSTADVVVREKGLSKELASIRADTTTITAVAISPGGDRIAIGGVEGIVRVYEVASRNEVATIRGQQGWCMGLQFSADGARLFTSIGDPVGQAFGDLMGRSTSAPQVRRWDLAKGQDYGLVHKPVKIVQANQSRGELVIAEGRELAMIDVHTGRKVRTIVAAPEEITAIAIHPSGKSIAVAWAVPARKGRELSPGVTQVHPVKSPHRFHLVDVSTGTPISDVHQQAEQITSMAFSADSVALAVSSTGKTLHVFDANTGKHLGSADGAEGGVSRVVFGGDGRLYRATTGSVVTSQMEPTRMDGGVIEEWDWKKPAIVRQFREGSRFCNALAVSPNGERLVAAMSDDLVIIDLRSSSRRRIPLAAHDLTFMGDNRRLVAMTGAGAKLVDIDLLSPRELLTLGGRSSTGGNTSRAQYLASQSAIVVSELDGVRVYDGRTWAPVVHPPTKKEPEVELRREPEPDDRSPAVIAAISRSVQSLEAYDPASAAWHALAALRAETDPGRQATLRTRLAVALQMLPKLRPVVPTGSATVQAYASDQIADLPSTPNVASPLAQWTAPDSVERSADGKRLLIWSAIDNARSDVNKSLVAYDLGSGKLIRRITLEEVPLYRGVAISDDGKHVAAMFASSTSKPPSEEPLSYKARVWSVDTGERVGADLLFQREGKDVQPALEFLPGGHLLVAKLSDGWSSSQPRQMIWDVRTGRAPAFNAKVSKVFGQSGDRFLVTMGPDRTAVGSAGQFREASTLSPIGKSFESYSLRHAAFSANGERIAIANSYYLGVWSSKTGERVHPRFHVYGGARCVAITRDGVQFAASYSSSKDVEFAQVWDGKTGDAITPPFKLPDRCHRLLFSADNRVLVTVTEKTVRLWDARYGEPLSPTIKGDGSHSFGDGQALADAFVVNDDLYVRRNVETSQFDRLSLKGIDLSVDEIRQVLEAITGKRLDSDGALKDVPADELQAVRRLLSERAPVWFGRPMTFEGDVLTRRPDARVPQLIARFDAGKTPAEKQRIISALGDLKCLTARDFLVQTLSNPDTQVRRAAAVALGELPRSPVVVAALVDKLRADENDRVRAAAARALAGPSARQATQALILALTDDKVERVRASAAYSLHDADDGDAVVNALRATFVDTQPWSVRVEAARSLANKLPNDTESIRQLAMSLEAININDPWAGTDACRYLRALGPRSVSAVSVLAKIVESGKIRPNYDDRTRNALYALAQIGPGARPALLVLLAKLDEDEANPYRTSVASQYPTADRNLVAYSIACIGPDAIPDLLAILDKSPVGKRQVAASIAIGFMGSRATSTLPKLRTEAKRLAAIENKSDEDSQLEKAIDLAIERIANPSAMPIEKLLKQ